MRLLRRFAALAMAGAALAGPCKPAPEPCTVALAGDSLTVQATFGEPVGPPPPGHLQVTAGLGWKVENVQQWTTDQVAAGKVDVLVVALGTNDSNPVWNGGWTAADIARFRTLINTPHPDAWVVLVLPGHGPGISAAHAAAMDQARADLTALAATRPHTVATDAWEQLAEARPELFSADGIHLRALGDAPTDDGVVRPVDPEARAARLEVYWDALPKCT